MADASPASCPKCGTSRDPASAVPCVKCGLAVDRMATFSETRDASAPEVLRVQWERVQRDFDSEAEHDELLRLVTRHDVFAWGAARYRDILRDEPGHAMAARQLDRMRKAAEVTMYVSAARRTSPEVSPYRATTALLILLVLAAIAGLVYSFVMSRRAANDQANDIPQQVR